MPQGARGKARGSPKKPKITKASKKGSKVTKRTPKKSVADKKKLQKAVEATIKTSVENEIRTKAGGRSAPAAAKKPAAKAKGGRKGKKK